MVSRCIQILFLIFIFAIDGSIQNVQGGEIISLKEVLSQASQHNLTLETARRDLKVSEGQVLQAKEIPNPSLSFSLFQIPIQNPEARTATKDISLTQPIEVFGKRQLRTKVARSDLGAGQAKYKALELNILKQAKEAYWDYSLGYQQVTFFLENLKFQQRFLARVQENFQSGQANLADLSRAKVEVARAFSDVFEARKKYETAQANLNRLIGQEVRQGLRPPARLQESSLPWSEDQLIKRALQSRPERNALSLLKEGRRAELKLAQRLLWAPDVNAQVVYQKGDRSDGRESWGGTVGLVFPLWNHYKGERATAEAKIGSLETQSTDLDQMITLEVHQAYLELRLSKEQLGVWKSAIDQATEAARLAEQRYLEGDADLLVFFQSRRDLVSTTLEYLQTLRACQANFSSLERAIGAQLTGD